MNWKTLPYWLKGGIIGELIIIPVLLLNFLLHVFSFLSDIKGIVSGIYLAFSFVSVFLNMLFLGIISTWLMSIPVKGIIEKLFSINILVDLFHDALLISPNFPWGFVYVLVLWLVYGIIIGAIVGLFIKNKSKKKVKKK
jgi:hypothetical protein